MTEPHAKPASDPLRAGRRYPAFTSPFLRAPEGARGVFGVTFAAACAPLAAGLLFFGWRAAMVTALAIGGCVAIEHFYYRVTRVPAMVGRSHAYLTGLLLALTLPAFVPWYIPLIAAAFAIIVGKGIFGGVGHFLWQPALVGRLAVAVMFPAALTTPFPAYPGHWPVLAQNRVLVGDLTHARAVENYRHWRGRPAPPGADALLLPHPARTLDGLTAVPPQFSALIHVPADVPRARPAVLMRLPRINDLLYGARPGEIGETCVLVILVAGLYLIYRHYVSWTLPASFLLAAAAVAAVAPIHLPGRHAAVVRVWLPLLKEGLDVGFIYVTYQILSGGVMLAAFFLATEMTSRPVTRGGQALFGVGCGAAAMMLKLYVDTPIPAYLAVLAMNTLTPTIDAIWRPRVFGQRHFEFVRKRRPGPRGA